MRHLINRHAFISGRSATAQRRTAPISLGLCGVRIYLKKKTHTRAGMHQHPISTKAKIPETHNKQHKEPAMRVALRDTLTSSRVFCSGALGSRAYDDDVVV